MRDAYLAAVGAGLGYIDPVLLLYGHAADRARVDFLAQAAVPARHDVKARHEDDIRRALEAHDALRLEPACERLVLGLEGFYPRRDPGEAERSQDRAGHHLQPHISVENERDEAPLAVDGAGRDDRDPVIIQGPGIDEKI